MVTSSIFRKFKRLYKKLIRPYRFKVLAQKIGHRPFKILDVGCGEWYPRWKYWFPNCEYYGLDYSGLDNDFPIDKQNIPLMKKFYNIDLNTLRFHDIPDNYFDVIIMGHVVEHLYNAQNVIIEIIKKLKPYGYLYIEFPSIQSIFLPSCRGTLNFFDDKTHQMVFDYKKLSNFISKLGYEVLEYGIIKNYFNIAIIPLKALKRRIKNGYVGGGIFWDLKNFMAYCFLQKNPDLEIFPINDIKNQFCLLIDRKKYKKFIDNNLSKKIWKFFLK